MTPMKQQFVITQHHPILQEREKVDILNGLILSTSFFYKNIQRSNCLWTQHFDRRCVCNPTIW